MPVLPIVRKELERCLPKNWISGNCSCSQVNWFGLVTPMGSDLRTFLELDRKLDFRQLLVLSSELRILALRIGFQQVHGNFTTYLRGEICTENFVLWYMYPHQNWQHSDKFLSLVLPSYWTGIWFQSVSWLSRCLIRLLLSWVECAHIGFSLALMFSGQLSRGDSWSEDFSISFRRSCHFSSFFKRIFCKKEKEKLKVGEKIFLFLLFPSVQ